MYFNNLEGYKSEMVNSDRKNSRYIISGWLKDKENISANKNVKSQWQKRVKIVLFFWLVFFEATTYVKIQLFISIRRGLSDQSTKQFYAQFKVNRNEWGLT